MAASIRNTILQGVTISAVAAPASVFDIAFNGLGGGSPGTPYTFDVTRTDTTGSASVDWAVTTPNPANNGTNGGVFEDGNAWVSSGTVNFVDTQDTATFTLNYQVGGAYTSSSGFVVATISNPVNGTIGTDTAIVNWMSA